MGSVAGVMRRRRTAGRVSGVIREGMSEEEMASFQKPAPARMREMSPARARESVVELVEKKMGEGSRAPTTRRKVERDEETFPRDISSELQHFALH